MARQLIVNLVGNARDLTNTLNQAGQQANTFGSKMKKAAGIGALAVGGALVGALKAGVDGLLEGAEAEAKFSDALSRSSNVMRGQEEALKANAEALQKTTKFSYEDALAIDTVIAKQQSLSGVVAKGIISATDLTNVSADLATVMGKDGAPAAELLAKALAKPESAGKMLLKAGVALTAEENAKLKALVASGDAAAAQAFILDKLKTATDGAAAAAGDTMSGKVARMQASFGEVQESLASALLPALETLSTKLGAVASWMEENPGKVKLFAGIVGGLAAAVGLWSAATAVATFVTGGWATSFWALNAALLANPIGLIVVGLALLGAGLVVAWKKSETFRNIVRGTWDAIKTGFVTMKDAVITGLAFLVDKYLWVVETLVSGAAKAFGWAPGIGPKLKAAAARVSEFRDSVNASLNGMKSHKDITVTVSMLKKNWDERALNPNGSTKYGPTIPGRAVGGPVTKGSPYVVGERGPELFVPGSNGTIVPNRRMGGGGSAAGGGGTTVISFAATGDRLLDAILAELRKHIRVNGGDVQSVLGRAT